MIINDLGIIYSTLLEPDEALLEFMKYLWEIIRNLQTQLERFMNYGLHWMLLPNWVLSKIVQFFLIYNTLSSDYFNANTYISSKWCTNV